MSNKNIELSRLLYARDEIEVSFVRNVLCKNDVNLKEFIFWFTEYYVSYGKDETDEMLNYVLTYALFSWDGLQNKKFCYLKTKSNCDGDDNRYPVQQYLDILKTYRFKKPNTTMYVFIKMFLLGIDGNGKWDKLTIFPTRKKNNEVYRVFKENLEVRRKKWRIFYDELSERKTKDLNEKPLMNLVYSLHNRHLGNIIYYMKTMNRFLWILYIDTYFSSMKSYENSSYHLVQYSKRLFNELYKDYDGENKDKLTYLLVDLNTVATILFVKWFCSENIDIFGEKITIQKKGATIKHKKEDVEWMNELIPITLNDMIDTRYSYDIDSDIKKMHLSFDCKTLKEEMTKNIEFHKSSTLFWKKNVDCINDNKIEECIITKRIGNKLDKYKDENKNECNIWYIPEWIYKQCDESTYVYEKYIELFKNN